jgi:hypothetical protein
MKIERSCRCLIFRMAAVVAAVGAVASSLANQGSTRVSNALPANIIVVTNTNDSGPGSLRDALAIANDGDTIDATGVSGTILLTSGELQITHNLTISGPGADQLAVDGNAQSRVFYVNSGKTVIVSGLSIRNGHVSNAYGGGIYNEDAALKIINCIISGNSADYGGGIYNAGVYNAGPWSYADLAVIGSTLSGNYGGGIFNAASGIDSGPARATLTITDSTLSGNYGGGIGSGAFNGEAGVAVINCNISGNSTTGNGAGISNWAAGFNGGGRSMVTVNNSTLNGNSAAGHGGGIYNVGGTGGGASLALTNSTLSANSAPGDGGGIYNFGDFRGGAGVVVMNSTLSGNSTTGTGGGIYNNADRGGAYLTVTNSTLGGNSGDHGGGIFNGTVNGVVTLAIGNTILSAGDSGENIYNDSNGTVSSLGYNLSSDDGGGYLTANGDQIDTDPLLGPLQDNGGATFTHALTLDSPAIDAGDPSFTPPPFFDQRGPGFDRVVNGRIDIGSFEVQGPTPTPTATPCGGAWEERSPVPYNAGGIFAASDGTFVYAGGGADLAKNIFHKDLLKYDPVNDSWTPLAPSPDYHYHSQAVYFDHRIYNIGGYDENLEVTNTTRIYDIQTDTWTTGAPMPQPLAQMATILWNGIIYIAGGNYVGARVNTLYAYDIASDTWTTLEPMPQAVTLPGFGAINGKLYIAGGSGDAGYLNTLYIYEIATNSWTLDTEANLPEAVARPGSCVLNGRLYLYGGRLLDLTPTIITQIYDPVTNAWDRNGPPLNVPLFSSYGTAVGDNSIVAPGGLDVNFVGLIDNEQLINIPCATPTPTPTPTVTPTPTATVTPTPTPTTSPTPTSTPRATPRPRPTPDPRPTP